MTAKQKDSPMIKLSIMICTMPSRKDMFDSLVAELNRQVALQKKGSVEILSDDSMSVTTGEKRNMLLGRAKGLFSVFVDDDDWVSEDYVDKIVKCITENPDIDCIGIEGQLVTNGANIKRWEISREFGRWYETHDRYYRTPNHISPIRTEICKKVGFAHITIGEDSDFSNRIFQYLIHEKKIQGDIYFYRYNNPLATASQEFPYRPAWR